MSVQKKDPYKVLEIERSDDAAAIKSAFRKLAMKHHPDHNDGSEESERKFEELREAYNILSDPRKRANYDKFGHTDHSLVRTAPTRAGKPQPEKRYAPKKKWYKKNHKDYAKSAKYASLNMWDEITWSLSEQWTKAQIRSVKVGAGVSAIAAWQMHDDLLNMLITVPAGLVVGVLSAAVFLALHHVAFYTSSVGRVVGSNYGRIVASKDFQDARDKGAKFGGGFVYSAILFGALAKYAYSPAMKMVEPFVDKFSFG